MTLATTVLDHARADRFDKIRDMFAPELRVYVPPETLRASWTASVAGLGRVTAVGDEQTGEGPGVLLSRTSVQFEHGERAVVISTSGDWIVGIQVEQPKSADEPQWTPPAYADPATFTEEEITLAGDGRTVPGTLTLPALAPPSDIVILLSGSGPHDRDETIGASRPFRDLAWGLAGGGIGVLRAEKVTYTHGRELPDSFTLEDEYVPHALAAITLLRRRYPDARVNVAGHSLGGTIAPRVVAEGSADGMILLAGGAQPMHWAAVRQMRYLATVQTMPQSVIDTLTAQAERVDHDVTLDTPAGELPFGTPAAYWISVRDYHPVEEAAELRVPILIVNGGRDYQVTVADDLALWREGLAGHPNVTFEVFGPANHLLAAGEGASTPAEYQALQHVAPEIVDMVARWIGAQTPVRGPRPAASMRLGE
jgi:pimeloyl-ACP methyl ester carboxylesterase